MAKDLILFIYAPNANRPKAADLLHQAPEFLASEATAGLAQVSQAHFWDFAGCTPGCVIVVDGRPKLLPFPDTPYLRQTLSFEDDVFVPGLQGECWAVYLAHTG